MFPIPVFPVYTGINRDLWHHGLARYCVPCIHRDKPDNLEKGLLDAMCSLYIEGLVVTIYIFRYL